MTAPTWAPTGDVSGLTDRPRLPRLGKIRLGIKKEGQRGSYPAAVDYFVVPDVVKSVYGDKPRELDVVFPSDDVQKVAPVSWKQYTSTRGKVCWGDGEHAIRLVDVAKLPPRPTQADFDDAIASADAKRVEWREVDCPAKECVFSVRGLCKPVMNIQFLLPKVPGIGVFQLDTGSINSILDVRGGIQLVMQLSGGRLAGVPLKLRVEPMEVISPDDQKKKVVHTLKLISPATLGKVLMSGERNMRELLMADEGPSRSVGLPELTGGREIPTPQEPEEDLYPRSQIVDVRAPEEPITASAPLAPVAPVIDEEVAIAAEIEELFSKLDIKPADRKLFRNGYRGKTVALRDSLKKQLDKKNAP